MDNIEPFDANKLEVGDEFAPTNWFYTGNLPPPYRVTRVEADIFYFTHRDFNNLEIDKRKNDNYTGYSMRLNNRYMEYDPTQQGDTDEDI